MWNARSVQLRCQSRSFLVWLGVSCTHYQVAFRLLQYHLRLVQLAGNGSLHAFFFLLEGRYLFQGKLKLGTLLRMLLLQFVQLQLELLVLKALVISELW